MPVNVEKKAAVYAQTLIEAFPHIGRSNPSISLPKEISEHHRLSSDVSEEEKTFVESNISRGKLFLLPNEEVKLRKVEEKARFATKKRTIVLDYVLYQEYESLCEEFDKQRDEYFALRDRIVEKWEERIVSFSRGLVEYLRGRGFTQDEVEKMHHSMMQKLPSKQEWYDSFYFDLEVREYPAMPGTLPGLDKKWEERTANLTRSILAEQVGVLFEKASGVLSNIMAGKPYGRKISHFIAEAGKILNHRILHESDFNDLAESIAHLPSEMNSDDAADMVEDRLLAIIQFAEDSHIFLDMNKCPVKKEYLISAQNLTPVANLETIVSNAESEAVAEDTSSTDEAETAVEGISSTDEVETAVEGTTPADEVETAAKACVDVGNEEPAQESIKVLEKMDDEIPEFELSDDFLDNF